MAYVAQGKLAHGGGAQFELAQGKLAQGKLAQGGCAQGKLAHGGCAQGDCQSIVLMQPALLPNCVYAGLTIEKAS